MLKKAISAVRPSQPFICRGCCAFAGERNDDAIFIPAMVSNAAYFTSNHRLTKMSVACLPTRYCAPSAFTNSGFLIFRVTVRAPRAHKRERNVRDRKKFGERLGARHYKIYQSHSSHLG